MFCANQSNYGQFTFNAYVKTYFRQLFYYKTVRVKYQILKNNEMNTIY